MSAYDDRMGKLSTLTPDQESVAVKVMAAASALGVLIGNSRGIAIGDDGVGYTAIADNLSAGEGLGYFLEPELTIWPPAWPAAMSLIDTITPVGAVGAAVILNAVMGAVMALLAYRLLLRLVDDQMIRLVTTAVVAVGGSAMLFGHLLMTDYAFVAVSLGLFLSLLNYAENYDKRWLIGSAALIWLAFSIRYAGVVYIATAGLWILATGNRKFTTRLTDGVIFGLVSIAFPIAWILRNLSIDDTILGERYGSARGLVGNALDILATFGNFLSPGIAIESRSVWAVVAALGIGIMLVVVWKTIGDDVRTKSLSGIISLFGTAVGLLIIQVGIYTLYMLYVRTTTGLNRLDFRLMNPIYLPLVFAAVAIIDRLVRKARANEDARTATAALGLFGSWSALSLLLGAGMVGYFLTGPDLFVGNYQREAFDEARESAALEVLPEGCDTMSNLPNALYEAGIEATWSPRLTGLESNDPVDDLEELENDLGNGEHCLVWIDLDPTYGHLANLERLNDEFELEELSSDGLVTSYIINQK